MLSTSLLRGALVFIAGNAAIVCLYMALYRGLQRWFPNGTREDDV